jgi:hypothetical protein
MCDAACVKIGLAGADIGNCLFAICGKLFERALERAEPAGRAGTVRGLPLRASIPSPFAQLSLALGSYNAFRGSGLLGEPRERSIFD